MTEREELKPCPFCGSKASFRSSYGDAGKSHWVECLRCRSGGEDCSSKQGAEKAWNRRAEG